MSIYWTFHDIGVRPDDEIDQILEQGFDSQDSILLYRWQIHRYFLDGAHLRFPKTSAKIQDIVIEYINSENNIKYWTLSTILNILDKETVRKVYTKWLNEVCWEGGSYIAKYIHDQIDLVKAIDKTIQSYKTDKNSNKVHALSEMVERVDKEHIISACSALTTGTPAIKSCMLMSEYLPQEYMLDAIKSVAKLKVQRKIKAKLDFELLKKLGPKTRLNAFEQLLNLAKWNTGDSPMPFAKQPSVNDVKKLLFPCSMRYNEQVSSITARYEELVKENTKEVIYGKSI